MRTGKIEALQQITCDKGVNQSTHPRLSPIGTFDTVQNMRIRGSGVLEKRYGTRAIGATSTDDLADLVTSTQRTPCFVASVGGVGCVGRSDGIVFFHQEVDDTVTANGRFSTCQPVRRRSSIMGSDTGTDNGYGQHPASVAANSDGYVMVATLSTSGLLYAAIDTPEGERLFTRVDSTASHQAKVVASSSGFILVLRVGTELRLQSYTISSGDVSLSSSTLTSSLMADSYIDAFGTGGLWYLVYQLNTGVLVTRQMNGLTSVQSANESGVTAGQVPAVSVFADDVYAWISWAESAGTYSSAFLLSNFSAVMSDAAYGQATECPLLFSTSDTANSVTFVTRVGGSSFGSVTHYGTLATTGAQSHVDIRGLVTISSPDDLGRFWAVACWSASENTVARVVLVSVRGSTAQIELALDEMPFASDEAFGFDDPDYFSRQITFGTRLFAAPFTLTLRGDEQLMRVELIEYSTMSDATHRAVAPAYPSLVVAGQPTELYAVPVGMRCIDAALSVDTTAKVGSVEIGYPIAPMILAAAVHTPGNLSVGTYSYVAVWEWADGFGRRHQSAPSEPATIELSAAEQAQITFPPYTSTALGLTMRFGGMWTLSGPYLVIYRTTAGGTEYHRLGTPTALSASSFDDNIADSTIADEEFVYTAGNVLPNVLAPSCRFARQAGGRLWCGGLWSEDQIECSKLIVPDEQPAFTGHASHRVSFGRPVTGLASIDDQLVIFAEDGIFTIAGDGPNDQGIGSFVVRSVSLGIGCVSEPSICETDLGVIFRSRLGFYLLPRGLGPPQYIGAAVQTTAASYRSLASATWHGNGSHLARFLSQHVDTGATVVFTFDVNSAQWFVDTFATSDQYPLELGVWPDGFVTCGSLQSALTYPPIWIEDTEQVADARTVALAGLHIEQRLRTNWINPSGPLGMTELKQAVLSMLPTYTASVTGLIETDLDSTSGAHSGTWALPASSDVAYRYLVPPNRGGVGYRITLYDAAVSGAPSGGVKFIAFAIESEPNDGIRLPDAGQMT